MRALARSSRMRLMYWSGELAVTSLKWWWKTDELIPAFRANSSTSSGFAYSAWMYLRTPEALGDPDVPPAELRGHRRRGDAPRRAGRGRRRIVDLEKHLADQRRVD